MSHADPRTVLFPWAFLAFACLIAAFAFWATGREAAAASPGTAAATAPAQPDPAFARAASDAVKDLTARHGQAEAARIQRGVDQVLRYWRPSDGGAEDLGGFLREEFVPAGADLDATFGRFESALESIDGYFTSMGRDLDRGVDLEIGPLLPLDRRLGAYEPGAHLSDDLFQNKVAFVALLNFPLTTLQQRLEEGMGWSRRQWAEARLAQRFAWRVPAEATQAYAEAMSVADTYIAGYNIYMHHLLTADGRRLFPAGMRLIIHWNLRDQLKADYVEKDGLPRQRMIQKVAERIVRQEIPQVVINNPLVDWTPETNAVAVSGVKDADPPAGASKEARPGREPDERYRIWIDVFKAARLSDPYFPDNPTHIDRRFNIQREIPEAQVKSLFESVLTSPLGGKVGRLIEKRLGRPLEPFDIWYAGFKPRAKYTESDLDAATKKRYPTADAYAKDMPRIFKELGFSEDQARFLADHMVVEPSRGPGHASGAGRRADQAHLRTRVGPGGMDYKGYNIAVHEMGHNAEQVFSMSRIDHTLLQGVPNTGFTEAMAMVFQARDLELLGLGGPDPSAEHLRALEEFWATREIAGVSLVDMAAWRWLYAHPEATPAQFREAVVGIAQDVWNRYFAPVFGVRDAAILAIYSHMVYTALYLPDYTLGHLIAFQIEEHFREKRGSFGAEFERICRLGSISPDAWMRQAVGSPLSAEPMIKAAGEALAALGG